MQSFVCEVAVEFAGVVCAYDAVFVDCCCVGWWGGVAVQDGDFLGVGVCLGEVIGEGGSEGSGADYEDFLR